MNRFAAALALSDALEVEGIALSIADRRLGIAGRRPSVALAARLSSFVAGPDLEPDAAELVARSLLEARPGDHLDPGLEGTLERARLEGPNYRALRAVVEAPSRAAREVLGLSVAFAVGLPHPFTIHFRRGRIVALCTSSRAAYLEAEQARAPAFVPRELAFIALVVADARASGLDLDRWLALKAAGPFVLTPALAGALHAFEGPPVRGPSFGEVFEALGAELVDVDLHARPE